MPAINQPKLKELYNTTFFTPSSLISSIIIPASNVAFTDGQGGLYYVGGITLPVMHSTVQDLASGGYVSSTQLFSTINDLSTAGYVSSTQLFSTINDLASGGYVSSTQLASTVIGLGTAGYLSSSAFDGILFSTVTGLGTALYVSSTQLASTTNQILTTYVSTGQLLSTVNNLSQLGYVSSTQLFSTASQILTTYVSTGQHLSTVNALSQIGYVSSTQLVSTVNNLSRVGYVSSTQLFSTVSQILTTYVSTGQHLSTVNALSQIGYVSSTQLQSTIRDLSVSGYVSSSQLESTIRDLGLSGYVSSTQLLSTVRDLSVAGYVSSTQLQSTVMGLSLVGYVSSSQLFSTLGSFALNLNTSSLVAGTISSSSTFINTLSTGVILAGLISSLSLNVSNNTTLSTLLITGNLSVREANQFNTVTVSTNQVETSTINFRDTLAANTVYNVYARGGNLAINGDNIIVNSYLATQLASTTQGLGSSRYISSTQLISTVQDLSQAGYVSSSQLQSTVRGLSVAGYVSSTQLQSTVRDLSVAGYVSSTQLQSTVRDLSVAGYVSSSQLQSTVRGLSVAGYVSSTQLISTVQALSQVGYVSSTQLISTVQALSQVGYVSSTQLQSTVAGLSFSGYVSSTQLQSTVAGLSVSGYVSSSQLESTIRDLALSGYISSTQVVSTVTGFTNDFVTSSLAVKSGAYMASTYTQFVSANSFMGDSIVSMRTYGNQVNNISYSTDGVSWTNPVVNGFLTAGNSVAYGLGIWVATGSASYAQGTIKYSVDRINWVDSLTGGFDNGAGLYEGYSVRFNGTIFMAGGLSAFGGTTQRSTDGSNWTASVNGFANPVHSIAWCPSLGAGGVNIWVAVGNGNGITNRSIQSSVDGSNWTAIGTSAGLSVGYGVTASATAIVAVGMPSSPANPTGNIVRSAGGAGLATWTSIGNASMAAGKGVSYNATAPAAAQWVVTGQTYFGIANTIFNAGGATPASFSAALSGGFTGLVGNGATWGNNKWVAVGAGSINGGTVLNSTDGRNWVPQLAVPFEYYGSYVGNTITYNSPYYMAVGNGETQTASSKATIIGPSSISTTHIDVDTLTANSILVSGQNTLTVAGNSFLNGATSVGGVLTTVGVNTVGAVSITGPVNINSNILTVPTVNARTLIASSNITLFDQTSNTNIGNIYYNRSLFFLNSNQILTDNAASGRLTLSTLLVTNTISTTSIFTSNISTSMLNARFISVANIYASTIGLGDIQYPWVVNRLFASSQMLYFNGINLTSSIVGNGCGPCINSNIDFTSVRADTISSSSTFIDILSTGIHYSDSISTLTVDTSTIMLYDDARVSSFSLRSYNGALLYNGESLGVIPAVVDSNPIFTTVTTTGTITSGGLFAASNAIISNVTTTQTFASTFVLQDQEFPLPISNCPLYVRSGLLFFSDSNIVPLGNDMLFSTIGVQFNTIAGSISTGRISTAQITTSSIITTSVSTNNINVNDSVGYTQPQSIYNSNGSLYYGRQPISLGGSTNASPFFSTLLVRQFVSTTSTVTDTINIRTSATTSNMFGFGGFFQTLSTLRVTTSNVVFMDRTAGSNTLITSNGALFYNNQAVQYGGTNPPGVSQVSTIISLSTVTTTIGTASMSVSTILGPTSIGFRDVITGDTNSITTRNGILYIGENQATGTVFVASNFTLSNMKVIESISTSSTFTNYLSTGYSFIDTLVTSNLNTASMNDGNSAFNSITVNNVNTRPYPIFNWGSNTTACCGSYAGYAQVSFTYPYTQGTVPSVTATLYDTNNDLAILNVAYIDEYGFTVGSFDINGGTSRVVSSVTFNYTAMGV